MAGEVRALAGEMGALAGEMRALAGEMRALASEMRALASEMRALASEVRVLAGEARALTGEALITAGKLRAKAGKPRAKAGEGVAVAGAGSFDAGVSWRKMGRNFPSNACATALALDPRDTRKMWLSLAGKGLFFSSNGGETFQLLSRGLESGLIGTLLFDPAVPSRVYAGVAGRRRLVDPAGLCSTRGQERVLNAGESGGPVPRKRPQGDKPPCDSSR